jgi:CYTH domain-containing protein
MELPRYSKLELERRWLVDRRRLPDLAGRPYRRIDDLYLDGGRLRLRAISHPNGARELKLGKKYERSHPAGGPITTLYLTDGEYAAFSSLPGARLAKRRYAVDGFSLDVFEGALTGLALAEVEVESPAALDAIQPPAWALREVTEDAFFTGGSLCRASADDLRAKLGAY